MGLFDSIGGAITGGFGSLAEGVFDTLGLPEAVGDVASGITNFATGNYVGLTTDVLDLAPNVFQGAKALFGAEPESPAAAGQGGNTGGLAFNEKSLEVLEKAGVDVSNLNDKDKAMLGAQQAMQDYNRMITLLTSLLQMQHEAQKAIIQNFRA